MRGDDGKDRRCKGSMPAHRAYGCTWQGIVGAVARAVCGRDGQPGWEALARHIFRRILSDMQSRRRARRLWRLLLAKSAATGTVRHAHAGRSVRPNDARINQFPSRRWGAGQDQSEYRRIV
jgi:hypothetical protein